MAVHDKPAMEVAKIIANAVEVKTSAPKQARWNFGRRPRVGFHRGGKPVKSRADLAEVKFVGPVTFE